MLEARVERQAFFNRGGSLSIQIHLTNLTGWVLVREWVWLADLLQELPMRLDTRDFSASQASQTLTCLRRERHEIQMDKLHFSLLVRFG